MQASEMTFGVEIECTLPNRVIAERGIRVGHYHAGLQIPGLPTGWTAQRDGSIRATRHRTGVEIVSPVLRGAEGLQQAADVLRTLASWGASVNRSTGLHVHVGAGLHQNIPALLRLVHLVAKFERALFALTGTKSREHGNYARPVSEDYKAIRNATALDQISRHVNKYRSLNLCPLFGDKRTVEFRVFQGTMNPLKLIGYVQICLGLIERAYAMKRTPEWSCSDVRYQDGKGLCYWMLRNLNWNSFARLGDRKFGVLLPARTDAVKREFKRLVAKYDADTGTVQHTALRPVVAVNAVNSLMN